MNAPTTPSLDLDAIETRLLPYDVIPHGPQDDGSLLLCFNDDGDTDVGVAWGRHRDAFADYVASSRTDLLALIAEVRRLTEEQRRDLTDVDRFRAMARKHMDERDEARAALAVARVPMTPPHIPATALGGDLVRDWTGPVIYGDIFPANTPVRWVVSVYGAGGMANGTNLNRIRLDPRRPEVAHRIADVLCARGFEAGPLLPVALGGRVGDAVAVATCDCLGVASVLAVSGDTPITQPCPGCDGSGTIRRTIPAADVSALLLCASVAGVEAGAGVVRGVLGEWELHRDGFCFDRHLLIPTVKRQFVHYARHYVAGSRFGGWGVHMPSFGDLTDGGEENGPEGRAAADAALLRLGFACLDSAAPFGVVVPFLNPEKR